MFYCRTILQANRAFDTGEVVIMSEEPVIQVKNLSKTFSVRERSIRSMREMMLNLHELSSRNHKISALRNINFEVNQGEIVGVIGRNGSGKSTLLNLIIGSMRADPGSTVVTRGKIMRMSLGMGFDPNLSARHNIYVNGSILGLTFKTIGQIFWEIIEFADLIDFVDTPIKYYSTGMRSRLAFSIAVHAEADIFLMDEIFSSVGDADFQAKSKKVFEESFLNKRTILFVSHSMRNIEEFSDRVLLIDKGDQIAFGDPKEVIQEYHDRVKNRK